MILKTKAKTSLIDRGSESGGHKIRKLVVSHAERDAPLAAAWKKLTETLFNREKRSIKAWYSSSMDHLFDNSQGFAGQIFDSIEDADFFLTIQTNHSASRPWVMWEVGLARGLRKPIFIVSYDLHKGSLNNPLDHLDQRDGMIADDCFRICRMIASKNDDGSISEPDEGKLQELRLEFDKLFPKYIEAVHAHAQQRIYASHVLHYELRIKLSAQDVEEMKVGRRAPADSSVIKKKPFSLPDCAVVEGDLFLFGEAEFVTRTSWGDFIPCKPRSRECGNDAKGPDGNEGLAEAEESFDRWRDALEATLWAYTFNKSPVKDRRAHPDGLPLVYSPTLATSFRPFVAEHTVDGKAVEFLIIFTELPRFLSGRPRNERLKMLTHLQDYCRMFRWGVLEEPEASLLANPSLSAQARAEVERAFSDAITSVSADFNGRGLDPYQITRAFRSKDEREAVSKLLKDYDAIVDDLFLGDAAKHYAELNRINGEFYMLISNAFARELKEYFSNSDGTMVWTGGMVE